MTSRDLLAAAYVPLLVLAGDVDEDEGWTPTRLPGWTVRDLLLHLARDAQRALVAFHTPTTEPPEVDEVTYWSAHRPGGDPDQSGLRVTRTAASAWTSVRGPAELFAETAHAVLTAASGADESATVRTQGRRLSLGTLVHTLAVEAAVHHLDLEPVLPEPPAAEVLTEVRRVLDGLLGTPAPAAWPDVRYALTGTGRLPLDEQERIAVGAAADRFPLFG